MFVASEKLPLARAPARLVGFDTTPVARKKPCAGQWDFYKAFAGRITEQSTAK